MAGSVRIRIHDEQFPAIIRAVSAGTGVPSEKVPGRSQSPMRLMHGTVIIMRACPASQ